MPGFLSRLDRFTTGIVLAVLLGLLLPCSGAGAELFSWLTKAAVVLLFFLYGVKLSRASVWEGLLHWRLQGLVAFATFILFPLLVPLLRPVLAPMVGGALFAGLLYVACLPSTVQSSIAFTSVAGGNVPAAVCSASVSSLLGVFATPLLAGILFSTTAVADSAAIGMDAVLNICGQVLLPFVCGQLAQPLLRAWVHRHAALIKLNDQATIWLVVYTAFSSATANGYWQQLGMFHLLGLVAASCIILGLVQLILYALCRALRFNHADRVAIIFCGSKKSLAVGAPIMLAIFGHFDNNLLLPLMIFHQVQLMVCARLAAIWKHRAATHEPA